MEKLNTIQKREKLNDVYTYDEKGSGNANHVYIVHVPADDKKHFISFQNGGRNVEGSEHGVTGEDLLEICRHRLQCFQSSEYACRENAVALTHIEEALMWLNRRMEDRLERNVLGVNSK